jgi:hypothetical protein
MSFVVLYQQKTSGDDLSPIGMPFASNFGKEGYCIGISGRGLQFWFQWAYKAGIARRFEHIHIQLRQT